MGPCTPLFQHRLELKGIVYKNMKFNAMKETTPAAMAAMCHTYQKIGSYQLALLRHIQSLTAAWAPLCSFAGEKCSAVAGAMLLLRPVE